MKLTTMFSPLRLVFLVSLLISASFIIWWSPQTSSPNQIYDQYFEPYTIQTTPRGLTDDMNEFIMGTIHYQDQDYEEAIQQFQLVLEENSTDYRAQLMLGISYLALKNFEAAEEILVRLVHDQNHLFKDQARWYLGLLYLTDHNKGNDFLFKNLTDSIIDSELKKKALKLD